MSLEQSNPRQEPLSKPNIEIQADFDAFVPQDFKTDPVRYFEEKGVNIKSGEVEIDDQGKIKEDPTAVKEFPEWNDGKGKKLYIVAKKVNIEKSQVGKTGDPFHEYKIMEIAKEFDLPAPKPIAKIEQNKIHIILMEKVEGFRWIERDVEVLNRAGLTEVDKENLIAQAEKLMSDLDDRFSEIGLIRKWKLKDMIFDIDLKTKTVRSLTPTDWERTKIDQIRLSEARAKKSGM